ncbi:sensor histidine kinase [Amycolatopsis nigrescens]|uniref:sensor histidine kinase n=1 Tax=Amycolatopsis nigrescens TaxID=381445 RepID=UPI0003754313|nr:sensor histidine kinase [Amycolatopsis nigrescens]
MPDPELRPLFVRRLGPGRLLALDALAAVLYTTVLLTLLLADGKKPSWWECLIVAGIGLPVAVRRRWPLPVFAVVFGLSLLSLSLRLVTESFLAAGFALYLVALTGRRPHWEPTLAIAVLSGFVVLAGGLGTPRPGIDSQFGFYLFGVAVLGGAWTVGRAVRERRTYAAHTAAQLADQAVTEERLRIARELHDVVAHSMGLIAVRAGVTNHLHDVRPVQARDALELIENTSRDALTEMRHLLGVLRAENGPEPTAELGPVPGLAGLPELAGRAAMAGVRVELRTDGVPRLPEGVELSAYRIVQEALTNVIKHAAPAQCLVAVDGRGGELRIEVTDDGPGARMLPARPGGHGLIGVRERVAMYGGEFAAGPRPEGGFRLFTRLPYGEPA